MVKAFFALSSPGEEAHATAAYGSALVLLLPVGFLLLLVDVQFTLLLAAVPTNGVWWADFIVGPLLVVADVAVGFALVHLQARVLGHLGRRCPWFARPRAGTP